ncbi:MAG: type II toxin-antitoxin system VapC family toxin [Thermodesulfobacteriota bacterium]
MKPTLYLETTIPSYYVSRPSRDIVVLAHQEITREWWERRLPLFKAYVSPVVIEEAGRGDPDQARKRLKAVDAFPILAATPQVEDLADLYMKKLGIPAQAIRDAAHLAFACGYRMEYVVTWNCAHIANAEIRRGLMALNATVGIGTPIICTPEELMGREEP